MEILKNFIDELNKNNLYYSLMANFVSTIIAGGIFFILKDKVFTYPDINGRYFLKIIVKETTYLPYREMELHFIVHLSSANGNLIGGGERVYEDSSYGKNFPHIIHYSGNNKIPIQIHGNIAKSIFGCDVANVMCTVDSKARKSNMSLTIKIPYFYKLKKITQFNGTFTWSVAGKSGQAFLSKQSFDQKNPTENTGSLNDKKSKIEESNTNLYRRSDYFYISTTEYSIANNSKDTNIIQ